MDSPVPRLAAPSPNPPEGSGDMVAIVFQHQSAYGQARHYSPGETLGWSGASAVNPDTGLQDDYGADVHLHIHGLNASGQRVDFLKFVGDGTQPPQQEAEEDMQLISVFADNGPNWGGNYGSTAIITSHRGFVQTSTGLGPRSELQAWLAVAGVLGFQIIEKHVDSNGFELAKRM